MKHVKYCSVPRLDLKKCSRNWPIIAQENVSFISCFHDVMFRFNFFYSLKTINTLNDVNSCKGVVIVQTLRTRKNVNYHANYCNDQKIFMRYRQ